MSIENTEGLIPTTVYCMNCDWEKIQNDKQNLWVRVAFGCEKCEHETVITPENEQDLLF